MKQEIEKTKWQQLRSTLTDTKVLKIIGFWAILVIAIASFWAIGSKELRKEHYRHYTQYEVYQETNMLIYDSIKYELVKEVDRYIGEATQYTASINGIVIVDKCLEHGIDICFVLAQGEQESHFGTQGLARKTNSVFNVFAFDGHSYNEINSNGKYKHPNDCVEPYLKLLERDYLVDGKTEYDLLKEYVNKNGARYASADTYENSLVNKMQKIKDSTKIDMMYQQLKRQQLILGM